MRSLPSSFFFFFNDTATTEIYTLSLHDALPICGRAVAAADRIGHRDRAAEFRHHRAGDVPDRVRDGPGNAEILRRRHQAAGRQPDQSRGVAASGGGYAT